MEKSCCVNKSMDLIHVFNELSVNVHFHIDEFSYT